MNASALIRSFATPVLALLCGIQGSAQEANPEERQTGLLYGHNHAYSLTAPKGWVLDSQSWADMGIHAIFYPMGDSPEGSRIAYTRFFPSNPQGIESAADAELAAFKRKHPSAQTRTYALIKNDVGMKVAIRSTITAEPPNAEWLAYIEAPTGVIFIAVVTKRQSELESLKPRFLELINSCRWLTHKVTIKQ